MGGCIMHSKQLKLLRNSKQKIQQEVCSALNIEQSTLANYENGKRVPKIEILIKIAEYYQCSVDFLLGIDKFGKIDYSNDYLLDDSKIKRITAEEEMLLQAFNRCDDECKKYLIAKAHVLSVEGISAVSSDEHEKYADKEKKSFSSNGIEEKRA